MIPLMERRLKKYNLSLLACLLLLPVLLHADDHLHMAQKTVTKKLTIAKGVQLSLNNQFGNMVIQSWKQKLAMVQITITGRSAKLKRANDLVRLVTIKSNNTPGILSLQTIIDTQKQYFDPLVGEQCHVNYVVFVPKGLKLSVTNRFGNIRLKSFDGELTVDEKFGDLKIENLSGHVDVDLEQGNVDVDRLNGGSLKFKGFNNIRIGELSGIVDVKFWSGGRVDLGLTGDLQKLNINADNVKPLNITNLKPANADLRIHGMVSKIIYNGHIMLSLSLNPDKGKLNLNYEKPPKADTVFITGKGDTTQKSKLTLLDMKKISITAMKSQDFTIKTGTTTTDIKIDASFSVVNVKD